MESKDLVVIRPAIEDDRAFILATWLRGAYYGEFQASMEKDAFMKSYHELVEHALDGPDAEVVVAALPQDPSVIIGYAVFKNTRDGRVLHWVFVKSAFRRYGVAKLLLNREIKFVSVLTRQGRKLKPADWLYNPFLFP